MSPFERSRLNIINQQKTKYQIYFFNEAFQIYKLEATTSIKYETQFWLMSQFFFWWFRLRGRRTKDLFTIALKYDRHSVSQLLTISGQFAESPICVCLNCPETRRWPTWVESPFSEWRDYQIPRSAKSCRLTIINNIRFSEFLFAPSA